MTNVNLSKQSHTHVVSFNHFNRVSKRDLFRETKRETVTLRRLSGGNAYLSFRTHMYIYGWFELPGTEKAFSIYKIYAAELFFHGMWKKQKKKLGSICIVDVRSSENEGVHHTRADGLIRPGPLKSPHWWIHLFEARPKYGHGKTERGQSRCHGSVYDDNQLMTVALFLITVAMIMMTATLNKHGGSL